MYYVSYQSDVYHAIHTDTERKTKHTERYR